MDQPKPTIAEIEAILSSPEAREIEILPDGSIHAVPMGTRKDAPHEIITAKYAAAEYY
jgi:CHAT domain-containing protein